jgi:hypothetical protein
MYKLQTQSQTALRGPCSVRPRVRFARGPLGPPAAMAIAIAFVDSNLDRAWAGARGPRWTSAITSAIWSFR